MDPFKRDKPSKRNSIVPWFEGLNVRKQNIRCQLCFSFELPLPKRNLPERFFACSALGCC